MHKGAPRFHLTAAQRRTIMKPIRNGGNTNHERKIQNDRFRIRAGGKVLGIQTGAGYKIIIDTQTGVHYLYVHGGYGGGLTALLDAEGKPVVSL